MSLAIRKRTWCPLCPGELARSTSDYGYIKTADYNCPHCGYKSEVVLSHLNKTGKTGEKLNSLQKQLLGSVSIKPKFKVI